MNDFVKALKDGTAYEYVLKHGDEMSHSELTVYLYECLYEMDKDQLNMVADRVINHAI